MAINRFDSPVRYDYVSQYVPIPFQELLTLGKAYNEEREKSEKQLAQYAKEVGDFNSRIVKDNQSYYNLTLGRNDIQSLIAEGANDPDKMKDFDYRQRLNRALLATDYGAIGKLKASKQGADEFAAIEKKLASEGKSFPGWQRDYFNTYDTLAQDKVFNETPLMYQSINDLVDPFASKLKDEFIRQDGYYQWYGVKPERLIEQIEKDKSSLQEIPQYQRHLEQYLQRGQTEDDLMKDIVTSAMRYKHENPVQDTVRMEMAKLAETKRYHSVMAGIQAAKAGVGKTSSSMYPTLDDRLKGDYQDAMSNRMMARIENGQYDAGQDLINTSYDDSQKSVADTIYKTLQHVGEQNAQVQLMLNSLNKKEDLSSNDMFKLANVVYSSVNSLTDSQKSSLRSAMTTYQKNAVDFTRKTFTHIAVDAFKNAMGEAPNGDYFQSVEIDGSNTYYGDNQLRKGFETAANSVMLPLDDSLQSEVKDLYFSDGFIPTDKMLSAKKFVLSNVIGDDDEWLQLVRQSKTLAPISNDDYSKLERLRNATMRRPTTLWNIPGLRTRSSVERNVNQFSISLDDVVSSGVLGDDIKLNRVVSYADQGDKRYYKITVDVPYKQLDKFMDRSWTKDNFKSSLKAVGYAISPQDARHKEEIWSDGYVTVPVYYETDNKFTGKSVTTERHSKKYNNKPAIDAMNSVTADAFDFMPGYGYE